MSHFTVDKLPSDLFKSLFEKSPGSLVVKADAPHFTILAASDGYLHVTAVTREGVSGKSFFEVFPDDNDSPNNEGSARNVFTKVIETGQQIDVPTYRYDILDDETNLRTPHYWSCSNIPIMDADNKVAYILNTVIDITAEVKAKERALESENRLLLAIEATGLAVWDLDLTNPGYIFLPQLAEIFGHPANTPVTLTEIRKQVHPDDMKNIVLKAYHEAMSTGIYLYEARVLWPDNSLHWIRTQGMVLYDDAKRPVRMLGTMLDITESKSDEIRKNDFIAMASHELKTPLTSLKAYLQLLESKFSNSPDAFVKTALVKCGNQVNKMTALIHSFLDLSKLEPGKLKLNRKDFDINKLIAEAIAESRLLANTHVFQFESSGEINVNADREKINQVLTNLINNAIKYSPKGSNVTLQCRIIDSNAQVSIADEGIGIKSKDQEKIFQRFYRAEEDELKNVTGFGIGLYLSSEIIQRHKGKIWVASEERKGSTFYFSLPLTLINS